MARQAAQRSADRLAKQRRYHRDAVDDHAPIFCLMYPSTIQSRDRFSAQLGFTLLLHLARI